MSIERVNPGQKITATLLNQIIDRVNGENIPSNNFVGTTLGNLFPTEDQESITRDSETDFLFTVRKRIGNAIRTDIDPDSVTSYLYYEPYMTSYYYINIGNAGTILTHVKSSGSQVLELGVLQIRDVLNSNFGGASRRVQLEYYDYPSKMYDNPNGFINTAISSFTKPDNITNKLYDLRSCLFGTIVDAKTLDYNQEFKALVISDYKLNDPGLINLGLQDWRSPIQNLFLDKYQLELSTINCVEENVIFAEEDQNMLTSTVVLSSEYFIQLHTGEINIGDNAPLLPWKVDANTLSIERPYCQIGTYQWDSQIYKALAPGEKGLSSRYDPQYCVMDLSCITAELSSQPINDYRYASFKMFRIREDERVEYYNINPVAPSWAIYYDNINPTSI